MQLTKNSIQQIIDIAENLGWCATAKEANYSFNICSPAGGASIKRLSCIVSCLSVNGIIEV